MLCSTCPGCVPEWPLAEEPQNNYAQQQPVAIVAFLSPAEAEDGPLSLPSDLTIKIPASVAAASSLCRTLWWGQTCCYKACVTAPVEEHGARGGGIWEKAGLGSKEISTAHVAQMWRNSRNSHLILAHAIHAHGQKQANTPSLQTHSEKETVPSHLEKLCQSLLAAACPEDDHSIDPCQDLYLTAHQLPPPQGRAAARCHFENSFFCSSNVSCRAVTPRWRTQMLSGFTSCSSHALATDRATWRGGSDFMADTYLVDPSRPTGTNCRPHGLLEAATEADVAAGTPHGNWRTEGFKKHSLDPQVKPINSPESIWKKKRTADSTTSQEFRFMSLTKKIQK